MTKTIKHFTRIYSLSKTLRFELIPQGKTKDFIEEKGLLRQDEHRAQSYQLVKKIIDRYHKAFIEKALKGVQLEGLEAYEALYRKKEKDEKEQKEMDALRASMRKQIADCFSKNANEEVKARYKNLFAKELIKEDLLGFVSDEAERKLVEEFNDFTTYFTGFHDNRKNMYTHEEKATAVGFRVVHENLPKFLDNVRIYELIQKEYADLDFTALEKEMDAVLQGKKLEEVFTVGYFNETITQTGIDLYNTLLGGISEEGQKKVQGLNEYINLYNQQKTEEAKREGKAKFRRVPQLKPLYKQILSDRETSSFLPEEFESDKAVLEAIEKFYAEKWLGVEKDGKPVGLPDGLRQLLTQLKENDTEKVFVKNDTGLTNVSQVLFGDWRMIKKALEHYYETVENPIAKLKKVTRKYENDKTKWLKRKYYSIALIEAALAGYQTENEELNAKLKSATPLCDYFAALGKQHNGEDLLQAIEKRYAEVKELLHSDYPADKKLASDKPQVAKIKALLDAMVQLLHFIKPLHPAGVEGDKEERFYTEYALLYDQLNWITPLYNQTRNYLTKKPYSTEKVKLNFENSTLMDGWDANKETANTTVLLRKNGLYYVAVMDKKHNKVFEKMPAVQHGEPVFEKVVYKLLPGANKMLPKVFFSDKNIKYYNPSAELLDRYERETHKKGASFDLVHCHELIDFFKASIAKHEDWKHFEFQFSATMTYDDLSGFYREVEQQGYKISFREVPEKYIDQLVEEGKLYLFQIYNKDFSEYSKGKPNLHTLYWKMLFDERNLRDVVYKLNGQAEVFYRKKSLNYDEQTMRQGHHAAELKGKFAYPIISNRRYALDKFQFHVPITMNFKASGSENINTEVLEFLKSNPDVNIIGIDRGERHLLYLTLIDQSGNIKVQKTLNQIVNQYNGKEHRIDYHAKLDAKEAGRDEARKSWGVIENIKELKEGYLSHVVHEVAKMMVEHNAIVVLEDLNFGFKRGRQKVEKQVYQKFEKMLIDKLNYLVFKDKAATEPGGALMAFQLANKFESFQKLGKQSGFIFYVPASLTSKIDPVTGFVDFLKPKYESVKSAQEFWSKFESITYNVVKQWFEFTFNYNKFTDKAEGSRTHWTVCSTAHTRYRWNPKANNGNGEQQPVNASQEIKDLFDNCNIAYGDGADLRDAIATQPEADFHKRLMRSLATLLMLRHNNGKKGQEEQDYILSPVAPFFDSRNEKAKPVNEQTLPIDADANGAYNIARKGQWLLRQIAENTDFKKVNLVISNKQWLEFVRQ